MPTTHHDFGDPEDRFGGLDHTDDCFQSIKAFISEVMDDPKPSFDWRHLACLAWNLRTSRHTIRQELESAWGLKFIERPSGQSFRTIGDNPHNLWAGNPCASGSGWEQVSGFAGRVG